MVLASKIFEFGIADRLWAVLDFSDKRCYTCRGNFLMVERLANYQIPKNSVRP